MNPITNKKGVEQLDMRGEKLHIGQSVLIMDNNPYRGRGNVSTGIIAAFDRHLQILRDFKDPKLDITKLASTYLVKQYSQLFEDKLAKKFDCSGYSSLREECKKRGLDYYDLESVSSEHVIGCTEKVRMEWIDGSLFKR